MIAVPQLRSPTAIAFLTLTVLIMAYAGMAGAAPIILFYALWLPQILLKGLRVVLPAKDSYPGLLFAFYAVCSTIWSDYQAISLYYSLEYASLVLCTLIICRVVSFDAWVKGLVAGCSVALLASLLSGNYGRDALGGAPSLVGLFGSKNQLGFYAEIGIIAALVILFQSRGRREKLLYAVFPLLIFCTSLYLSKSASSVISLAGTVGVLLTGWLIARLPRRTRRLALVCSLFLLVLLLIIIMATGLQTAILTGFGKDATLTGRTYLWAEGLRIGLDHPLLGDGYAAFWVPGRPEAERYWYDFQVYNRTGFHFHNLFVQVFVDLGLIGVLILGAILLACCLKSLGAVLRYGMQAETAFPLAMACLLAIRAVVEVDLVGSFGIGPIIFYAILPRLAQFRRRQTATA